MECRPFWPGQFLTIGPFSASFMFIAIGYKYKIYPSFEVSQFGILVS